MYKGMKNMTNNPNQDALRFALRSIFFAWFGDEPINLDSFTLSAIDALRRLEAE